MNTTTVSPQVITWRDVLHERNMKWYFGTQGISLIGMFLRAALIGLLIPQIVGGEEKAAVPVTVAAALNSLPGIFLAIVAGAVLDRFDKRKVLRVTTFAGITQLLMLAYLSSGELRLIPMWEIQVLALFGGVVGAVDSIGRSAILNEALHGRRDKVAVAGTIFSCLYTGGMTVGSAFAGYLTEWKGFSFSFITTALISSVLLVGLAQMDFARDPSVDGRDVRSVLRSSVEGTRFALGNSSVLLCIIIPLLVVMLGYSYQFILPIVKKTMFNGGLQEFGKLGAMAGIGTVVGSLSAVIWSRKYPLRLMVIAITVLGIGEIWFGYCTTIPMGQMAIFLCGFGVMCTAAPFRGLMLEATPKEKHGVVLGVSFTCTYLGLTTCSLITGQMIKHIGGPAVFKIFGAILLVLAIVTPYLPGIRKLHSK